MVLILAKSIKKVEIFVYSNLNHDEVVKLLKDVGDEVVVGVVSDERKADLVTEYFKEPSKSSDEQCTSDSGWSSG